jgi:hypothetical protein
MKWVDATVEVPVDLINVFVKITWRKRLIKQVAFYSSERKEFFTKSGDTFKRKNVQWMKDKEYLVDVENYKLL